MVKKRKVGAVGVSPVPGVLIGLPDDVCPCCGQRHSDYVIAGQCLMCGEPGAVVRDDDVAKMVYCVACDCISGVVWSGAEGVPTGPQNGGRISGADKGVK